jgi:HEAT repeat protein
VFQEAVKAEIPRIIALLSDSDSDTRSKAAELFGKLVNNREFICITKSMCSDSLS